MGDLSPHVVRIVSEFAAGGALLVAAIHFTVAYVRRLFGTRDVTPTADHPKEVSDAQLLGEMIGGAFVAGWGAAWYEGALQLLENPTAHLVLALIVFGVAGLAVRGLFRERLPSEQAASEVAHLWAWLSFIAAGIPLLVAACEVHP